MKILDIINIKNYYSNGSTASRYVEDRFASEVHRLLHERQVATVQAAMAGSVRGRALEVAPGPGRVTRDLRPSERVVCLEFSEAMIAHGRPACGPAVEWVRGDAFRLPFAQEFDLVYSFRLIRHFHRPDRERLYAEISRVLRPGGTLLFDAVNERISRPLREARPGDYPIYDVLYRPDALRSELAEVGLVPVALVPVQKAFRCQSLSQVLLGPRAPRLNRLVIRALERLPHSHGLEWIVECRRA